MLRPSAADFEKTLQDGCFWLIFLPVAILAVPNVLVAAPGAMPQCDPFQSCEISAWRRTKACRNGRGAHWAGNHNFLVDHDGLQIFETCLWGNGNP